MIELSLLKAMSVRSNLEQYGRLLNPKILSNQSIELLKDYQKYFTQNPDESVIQFDKFSEFFFLVQHPNLEDKQAAIYKEVINQLQNTSLEGKYVTQIIKAFEQQELYIQLHQDLDKNVDIETLKFKIDTQYQKMSGDIKLNDDEDMDLSRALAYTDRSNGLQWRLECLKEHFNGGLIKGDFGIIAGYVDSGKTSFIASEVSHMAEQLKGDQWIAWLNTEGNWEQIIPRIYCATLNCTSQDLQKWTADAVTKYTEKMNGNRNRIRVLNFQRKSVQDVENLIRSNPPSLIVFDLLDHIQGFDKLLGKDGNATERYGALYQWARTVATEYCPVLAISQLNGDGNNEPYPSITNLRGSRVDKQAAATFQLILGGLEGNSSERFLSMPKNKISSDKSWRVQVQFDPLRSRFKG